MKKNSKKAMPRHGTPKNALAARRMRDHAAGHGHGGHGSRPGKPHGPGRGPARPTGPLSVAEGTFSGTRHGYGFVNLPPEEGGEVFIPAAKTRGALDGDRVEITYRPGRDGKSAGEVSDLLSDPVRDVSGTLAVQRLRGVRGGQEWFLLPDSSRLPEALPLPDPGEGKAGDKVLARLTRSGRNIAGEVIRVFGKADTLGANYEAILADCAIPTDFSAAALREAQALAATPLTDEGRVRHHDIVFTMDGADAKDLDDAVSLQCLDGGGYLLGVHIADVSEYVRPGTALDRAAMERGTSVYFTDKVVPMLPPALSNGACSLNPGEDRYALSALLRISREGSVCGCKLEKSIIRSRVRGVYSEVNDLLATGEQSRFYDKYREVYPTLLHMQTLYNLLAARSGERGVLETDAPEAVIALDETGTPVSVQCRERGVAEKMIEQFMLAANEGVATLCHTRDIPCVYREHPEPPPDKLRDFLTYAHNLGLSTAAFHSRERLTAAVFADLLHQAEEQGLADALTTPLLRAMAKARYTDRPGAHFGLSLPLYCHFTSPIRRLSDLVTHRMIKAVLLNGESPDTYRTMAHRAALAATDAELRALSAERQIEALYKTLYLSHHIGEEYDARILSVTSFGLFAQLDNTCEGLIPIGDLPGFFRFSEETLTLQSNGLTFRIADPIRIRVEEADLAARRCRFALVQLPPEH